MDSKFCGFVASGAVPMILQRHSNRRKNGTLVMVSVSPEKKSVPIASQAANVTGIRKLRQALLTTLIEWELLTRPGSHGKLPRDTDLFQSRFNALPEHAKGPNQILGRITNGCEGTNSVFPRCTFACQPCYHSADANKVRTDGLHTKIEVARQMQVLQEVRGSFGHCQLIGGEVSLLEAEDHYEVLKIMRSFGRLPMSFSHGDFEYEYLKAIAVDPKTGKKRLDRMDWAVHFDKYMVGRRGAFRPESEMELVSFRKQFMDMVKKLRKDYGVDYYVAHNMTVQQGNLEEIPVVLENCKQFGFRMFSFQPAAQVGNEKRWSPHASQQDDYGECVWQQIEKGIGTRLPYNVFQIGDVRCNRTCWGAFVGSESDSVYVPFLMDDEANDLAVRDEFLTYFGTVVMPLPLFLVKMMRSMIKRPYRLGMAIGWLGRFIQRAGLHRLLTFRIHPTTIVMHRFMDAEDVVPAWELLEANDGRITAPEGTKLLETQQRLKACSYAMSHPDTGKTVPACVQHSYYDPETNRELSRELPLKGPNSHYTSKADQ